MARNYGNYDTSDSDDGNNGGYDGGNDEDDKTLITTPYAEIEGELTKVFGNENRFGQSLGISWENVELVDGCLYYDSEKDKHKVFAWKDVIGMNPGDGEFTSGDANQFLVKNYGGTEKKYELVEAVHPDQDDPVAIGNAIMWYSGSDKYGPKSAAKTLAQMLTTEGRNMVIRDDDGDVSADIKNWLTETSGNDITRPDLQGRRFAFFEIKKDSNQSDRKYHHPIVEDVETETQVTVNNDASDNATQGTLDEGGEKATATDGGKSREEELQAMAYSDLQTLGSETDGATGSGSTEDIIQSILDAESGVPAAQTEAGVPEAITDFVTSVAQFDDFTRDRAETLMEDFISDDGLPLTQDLVDDFGGNDAVLAEAGY